MIVALGLIGFLILALAMIVCVQADKLSYSALVLLVFIQLIGLCLLMIGSLL